jgi:hypothetical protein
VEEDLDGEGVDVRDVRVGDAMGKRHDDVALGADAIGESREAAESGLKGSRTLLYGSGIGTGTA